MHELYVVKVMSWDEAMSISEEIKLACSVSIVEIHLTSGIMQAVSWTENFTYLLEGCGIISRNFWSINNTSPVKCLKM